VLAIDRIKERPTSPAYGAYKFKRQPTGDVLAIDRIKEIHAHRGRGRA
jgi:hypothetical protein